MDEINVTELSNQVAQLAERVAMLEASFAGRKARRRRIGQGALWVGVCLCLLTSSTALALTSSGASLFQFMGFTTPGANLPALDTSVRWDRVDPAGVPPGHTNQVLSLISDATQQNSFTWPLYIQLNGTNSPSATQASSQSVGVNVTAFNRSTGSPWLAGYHSEVHHGVDGVTGAAVAANGASILFNGELTTRTGSGLTIGLNLQNTGSSTAIGTHAINIQPGPKGWQNGIHFDPGPGGNIGVNFESARYNMGIDLANNSIRMNANQQLILEQTGTVFMRYNSNSGRVEIVRGGAVVASF